MGYSDTPGPGYDVDLLPEDGTARRVGAWVGGLETSAPNSVRVSLPTEKQLTDSTRQLLGPDIGDAIDRRAFPGQCGFLCLQGRRGEQPSVGSDDVSCLDLDDVTRHQFGSVELNQVPVTNDPRLGCLHLGERVDAGPCLQLLSSSEDDVEHDEHRHHDRSL